MSVVTGQRLKAVDFIIPEKRELFLSGGAMPILRARVTGIQFAEDPNRAEVQVAIESIGANGERANWIATERWFWQKSNWFLDVGDPKSLRDSFLGRDGISSVDSEKLRAQFESEFRLLDTSVDIGTVLRDGKHRIPISIEYRGQSRLQIKSDFVSELVNPESSTSQVNPSAKEFGLLLDTELIEGPFALPYPMKIHYEGITVDRTVTLRGNVLVPVSLRYSPDPFPSTSGQELQLSVKNNTDSVLNLTAVRSDGIFRVLDPPDVISAHAEITLTLQVRPERKVEDGQRISILLSEPVYGRSTYSVNLRLARNP
jgi:hypothetical protein